MFNKNKKSNEKEIANLAITFDGFIEGPNGDFDWIVREGQIDFGDILNEILSDKDVLFYDRINYDKWGNSQPDENSSPKIKEAYKLMHSKKKYVFSKTKTGDNTKAIFINTHIKERVLEIKKSLSILVIVVFNK